MLSRFDCKAIRTTAWFYFVETVLYVPFHVIYAIHTSFISYIQSSSNGVLLAQSTGHAHHTSRDGPPPLVNGVAHGHNMRHPLEVHGQAQVSHQPQQVDHADGLDVSAIDVNSGII